MTNIWASIFEQIALHALENLHPTLLAFLPVAKGLALTNLKQRAPPRRKCGQGSSSDKLLARSLCGAMVVGKRVR